MNQIIDTAIFSGRMDPLHTGHILTLTRLLNRFSKIIVPVLDYENRVLDATEVASYLIEIFEHNSKGRVIAIVNKIHFGKITKYEYIKLLSSLNLRINETVYLSGNQSVIDNFEKLGIRNEFVGRSGDFSGTEIRNNILDVKDYYSVFD